MRTKLDDLFRRRGVKNIQLARSLGVSEIAISAWKRGRLSVPKKHRKALAKALGVEVEDILDDRGLAKLVEEASLK